MLNVPRKDNPASFMDSEIMCGSILKKLPCKKFVVASLSEDNISEYNEMKKHFLERLKERYDIIISDQEYENLINDKPNYVHYYRVGSRKVFCTITIKDQTINCIYKRQEESGSVRGFVTCLPKNLWTPTPSSIFKIGYSHEEYGKALAVFEQKAKELSETYKVQTKKEFFTNDKIHSRLKCAAMRYAENGIFEVNIAAMYFSEYPGEIYNFIN